MSDLSNIDSEKILSAVSQSEGIVDRINGCVMKFSDAINTLDNGWVSEVKADFMANYQLDHEAIQEMMFQLMEINDGLRDAAGDFDKTEGEITTAVKALR